VVLPLAFTFRAKRKRQRRSQPQNKIAEREQNGDLCREIRGRRVSLGFISRVGTTPQREKWVKWRRTKEHSAIEESHVALTPVDRDLLKRCLSHQPGAWNDFVDRYLGLIYHVIHHTAHLRSAPLKPEDTEDLAAEVLLQIVQSDYAVLRQFKGNASLATYLTVIARRICVHELARRAAAREVQPSPNEKEVEEQADEDDAPARGLESLEEVEKLLGKLPSKEREIVRLYYLEGRTYEEISTELNVPVNTIGPILSRARKKLRKDNKEAPPKRDVQPKTHES
jgi:RNA polymerase sigma-70 factor, ECF subfamily